jgi:putative peptidoglycan lipid II flippase
MTGKTDTRSTTRAIALAALLIALGNVASRALGLVREATIAFFFWRGSAVDAFTLAWTIPNTIYDLLINGAVSAALVPVLSEYAEGDADEFGRLVASIFTIALAALCGLLALAAWQAPLLTALLVQAEQVELRAQTTELVRLLLPAVLLMGLSGLITAVLHARRTFLWPAFGGAIFNGGMIVAMVLLHDRVGVGSLAIGALIGAAGQVLVQLSGLRGVRLRAGVRLRHPAVRRILLLYAPVALGIGFSILGTVIDRWLASGLPSAPTTMRYATTLIQFPLGLVAAAVSLAVLPTLSRQSAGGDEQAFRTTLAMGLKVVILLIVPATLGLAALAEPLVALVLQRGAFVASDSAATATALRFYLPGLPAAAIDQVLLFAFYARKNTLTPNIVQGAAIGFYLLAALPLLLLSQLGFLALVLGNSAQWIGHALLLWWLLRRDVPLGGLRLGEAALKALLAGLAMAAAVGGLAWLLRDLPLIVTIGLAGGAGVAIYMGLSALLKVEALGFFLGAVARRLGR